MCHVCVCLSVNLKSFFLGTTMKGAIDDLDLVLQTLNETGFTLDRFYIHCDGALSAMMLPFIRQVSNIIFGCFIYVRGLHTD